MTSTVDTLDEATAVLEVASGAQVRHDWDTAGGLLESLRDSTVVVGEMWTEVRLGEDETARTHFLQGLGIGAGGEAEEMCGLRLDMLDAQDEALKTAGILPL